MARLLLAAAGATALLAASAVSAQTYRDEPQGFDRPNQPETLAAPPPTADPSLAVAGRFRARYASAKSPRVVVLWNQEYTDDTESEYEDVATFNKRTARDGSSLREDTAGPDGAMTLIETAEDEDVRGEMRASRRRIKPGQRDAMVPEAIDFDVRQGFQGTLAGAGARLVDRSAIIRETGVARGRDDAQTIEAAAMAGAADLMIEVVKMRDPRAAEGFRFRVVARSARGGRVYASFSSSGVPPVGRMPLVAGPNGFERARPRAPGPYDIGRQLAVETMAILSNTL